MVDSERTASGQEFVSQETFGKVVDVITSKGLMVGITRPWGIPSEMTTGNEQVPVVVNPEDLKRDPKTRRIIIFKGLMNRAAQLDMIDERWKITSFGIDNLDLIFSLGQELIEVFHKGIDLSIGESPKNYWE